MHNTKTLSNYKNLYWLSVAGFVFVLDQITKWLVLKNLAAFTKQPITPWLNLHLAYNQGAAFNFLRHAGGWQRWLFIAVAIVMFIVIIRWLCRLSAHEKLTCFALSLIFGGALGNFWNRLTLGYVV